MENLQKELPVILGLTECLWLIGGEFILELLRLCHTSTGLLTGEEVSSEILSQDFCLFVCLTQSIFFQTRIS